MRILVTGAGGFVGGHLMRIGNEAGHTMIAAHRSDCDFEAGAAAVRSRVSALLKQVEPDALIHLAGPLPASDAERCRLLCIEGTAGLIEGIAATMPDVRVVAAGSGSEIGTFPAPRPCVDENIECRPISAYGEGKLAQSEAILECGGTAMRLFNSTGPGQGPHVVTGRIIEQLAAGATKLTIRETRSVRDFLDVRDAARAFLMAVEALPPGRYNVCSGYPRSIGELVAAACDAAGAPDTEIEVELPDYEGDFVCGDPSLLESCGWNRNFHLSETLSDFLKWARSGAD